MPRTDLEQEIVQKFMDDVFFGGEYAVADVSGEEGLIDQYLGYIDSRFRSMKYILGLGLDFCVLAQKLSHQDTDMKQYTPNLSIEEIFERYELVKSRGSKKANTLTLKYGDTQEGIRKIEESVANLFHAMDRSDYPSAYVYNTGQWQKYQDLLTWAFQLSESGKWAVCNRLISYGLESLPKNSFYVREQPRVRLFEQMIQNYERSAKGENGGLVFQAIAYGYLCADRPHLALVADKVRTGSSRQKRFGDIDCYGGLDLETSVEVKDIHITPKHFDKELAEFCRNCAGNNIVGIAFVAGIDEVVAKTVLQHGVRIITHEILLRIVDLWDWEKQNSAVQGTLHYLSHIEQNPSAVVRLLEFIRENDSNHDSLEYLA